MFQAILSLLILTGCSEVSSLKEYHTPKEERRYSVPSSWNAIPATEFREASFQVIDLNGQEADVSVVCLEGVVGTDLDNVNRWRQEIGLMEWSKEELTAEKLQIPNGEATLVDLSGNHERIVVAYIHLEDRVRFYKLKGDPALVESEKNNFLQFVYSY